MTNPDEAVDLERLLHLYLALPHTPSRASRYDRRLALELRKRPIPWRVIEAAFLLARARRCLRDPSLQLLPPIRSLHYFLPVIEEVLTTEISPDYVRYLKRKLTPYLAPDLFSE
jgi:hypothetical protein